MMPCWKLLLLFAAAASFFYHRAFATSVNCASGTGNLQNNLPLPDESVALFLLSNASTSNGTQVIVPQMAFGCSGRITAWTAHTLIITKPNFVEFLTHHIAMQVWRPSTTNPGKYSLVGSNELLFTDTELTNHITPKSGTTELSFFSFTKNLTENEEIYFSAGDVIGWYEYPQVAIEPPLSVIYREPFRNDSVSSVVRLLVDRAAQESCSLYNTDGRLGVIDNVVPLVTADFKVGRDQTHCSASSDDSNSDATTNAPPTATPTSTPPDDSNSGGQATSPQRNSITTSDAVCIVIAVVTMVLHMVLIGLCGFNCLALREIRKKLNATVVPHSKSMNLVPAYNSNRNISDETPADYDANPNAQTTIPRNYESPQHSPSPTDFQEYESIDGSKADTSINMHLQVPRTIALAGTESPAWSRSENNSLNGSKTELINHRV